MASASLSRLPDCPDIGLQFRRQKGVVTRQIYAILQKQAEIVKKQFGIELTPRPKQGPMTLT